MAVPTRPAEVSGASGRAAWKAACVSIAASCWAIACVQTTSPELSPRRPNVVVYLIDALRPDRLGAYGHEASVSPRIDSFALDATLFESAWAQSSWTKASVGSIFTGVWPPVHGANRRQDVLPDTAETLAERLRAKGYWTAALSANPNIVEPFGFAQGFDSFQYFDRGRKRSAVAHDALEGVLDQAAGRPFFLYLHTVDPHTPYAPPSPFRERYVRGDIEDPALGRNQTLFDLEAGRVEATAQLTADLEALYAGEIASNDHSFGLLLDTLSRRGLAGETVVVLVSDHGEEFGDHGRWTHGKQLYVESLAIPLIIRLPGVAGGRRVEAPVQQIDLVPTLLDYLRVDRPDGLEGLSLLPLMTGESMSLSERALFSYLHLSGPPGASVVHGDWKLIERYPNGKPVRRWLFNLRRDPGEAENLADVHGEIAQRLSLRLAGRLERDTEGQPETLRIDETLRQELEALGYLQ